MTQDARTPGQKWYDAKRLDPRWQRTKSEVMLAAGFKCQDCGDSAHTLNVHHKEYVSGREPWDYPKENFVCCCEKCHELREQVVRESRKVFQEIDPHIAIVFLQQLVTSGLPIDKTVGELALYIAIMRKIEGRGGA